MLYFLCKVQGRICQSVLCLYKFIKSVMIFPGLFCLVSQGINYNSIETWVQPGMVIPYSTTEVVPA